MALILPYTEGDQLHYRLFYDKVQDASLIEAFQLSVVHIDAYEPVSIAVLWLGAKLGLDKDIYISFLNTILLTSLLLFLLRHKTNSIIIFLFLANFYLVVLMTGAERLKIAYIFLLLGAILSGKVRLVFAGLSSVAHFQSLILLISALSGRYSASIKKMYKFNYFSKRDLIFLVSFVFISAIFYVMFSDGLSSKVSSYLRSDFEISEFFQIIIMGVIGLYLAKRKLQILLALLSMIPFVAAFGGDRVNMIAFTLVTYFLVTEGRQNNFIFISLMLYMSFKSISFIGNIYANGNGFYGI